MNCEYREIVCQNDCGAKFQKRFLQKHLDRDCPKKIIACPYCDDRHMREDKKVKYLVIKCVNLTLQKQVQKTFSACMFFSPIQTRDVLQGIWLLSCHNVCKICMWCTFIGQHFKETVLWGTITWSEIRKQNIQTKKVYTERLFVAE